MKVDHISSSGLKTHDQCPLKYSATYEMDLPKPPPHPNTVMGSAVHEMMEHSTKNRIQKGSDLSRNDPMTWKAEIVAKLKVEYGLHPLIDELVGNAVRWGYFRNINRTVGCEVPIDFPLPDDTHVTGFIDRLDVMAPDADIIDLKTQKNAFSDEELEHNWQAKIYNIGARIIRPEITGNATVSFWVLRHMVQRVVLTAEDAVRDTKLIADKVAEIKACKDPEGRPSGLCPWCPYDKQCPVKNGNARQRLQRMMKR